MFLSLLLTSVKLALSLPMPANSACAGTRPASPAPTVPTGAGSTAVGGTCFKGAEFPKESIWLSFNTLVSQHTAAMAEFDSSTEIANVLSAIQSVAQMSGGILDPYVCPCQRRAASVLDDLNELTVVIIQAGHIRPDDSRITGQRPHRGR